MSDVQAFRKRQKVCNLWTNTNKQPHTISALHMEVGHHWPVSSGGGGVLWERGEKGEQQCPLDTSKQLVTCGGE